MYYVCVRTCFHKGVHYQASDIILTDEPVPRHFKHIEVEDSAQKKLDEDDGWVVEGIKLLRLNLMDCDKEDQNFRAVYWLGNHRFVLDNWALKLVDESTARQLTGELRDKRTSEWQK